MSIKDSVYKRDSGKIPSDTEAERFMNKAPDQRAEQIIRRPSVKRGKRIQITHTFPPDLLDRIDELAELKAISRSSLINLVMKEYVTKQKLV